MTDRVVVFMDYQNVHGWARRQFLEYGADNAAGHVDPLRVGQWIVAKRNENIRKRAERNGIADPKLCELSEVRVYRGRPNPEHQAPAARANDRQTDAWERSPLVTVIRRNLRYPPDYPKLPAEEKGIDVAIAVDMIHMACTKRADVVVLFSSDTDLLPAVERIFEDGLCHVEVAAWQKGNRLRFPDSQLPWCHSIGEAAYKTLQDTTDYSVHHRSRGGIPANIRPRLK